MLLGRNWELVWTGHDVWILRLYIPLYAVVEKCKPLSITYTSYYQHSHDVTWRQEVKS
jgi:hypothetical protein